ncbi:hypothetical protein [Ornithinimicrobium kibberense]|uniref:hypothetical protein n=1 Tax=Ornithinimicrobium kibberense TaxID=282060 RepID=UPI0036090905
MLPVPRQDLSGLPSMSASSSRLPTWDDARLHVPDERQPGGGRAIANPKTVLPRLG